MFICNKTLIQIWNKTVIRWSSGDSVPQVPFWFTGSPLVHLELLSMSDFGPRSWCRILASKKRYIPAVIPASIHGYQRKLNLANHCIRYLKTIIKSLVLCLIRLHLTYFLYWAYNRTVVPIYCKEILKGDPI